MKLRNLVSVVSAGILGCVSSFGFATPANADLNICSEAGSKAFVAISYKANGIIWSKGWLILEPGDVLRCTIWVQAQQTWTVKNADQAARCIGKERGMGGFNVFRTNNSRNYTYTVYD